MTKLFCIPYAGGNSNAFNQLKEFLKDEIELVGMEYAGHSTRAKEDFYSTFDEMATDIANKINELNDSDDYALFGYSMGSVVAFEMLQRNLLSKMPKHLFIASHEAPSEKWDSMDYDNLSDEEFFDIITKFGGIEKSNANMLNNRFFRKLIFNPIRADYRLIAQYMPSGNEIISINTTMLYSPNDVPTEKAKKWQNHFNIIEFIEIGDNHFFINSYQKELAKIINDRI